MRTVNPTSEIISQLETEIQRMMTTLQNLKGKVHNDDLTGLLRRNEFFARLDKMCLGSQGATYSIIMLDIDNFKQINDTDGHVVGDHVLQRVAKILKRCEKIGAQVGRFGGEEFIIAFFGTQSQAKTLAEALRRQIQKDVNVTVSVGVATAQPETREIRKLVGQADAALYEAKHGGKNQVRLAA